MMTDREDAFWDFVSQQAFGEEWKGEGLPPDPDPVAEDDEDFDLYEEEAWLVKAFEDLMESKGKGYVDTDPDPSPKPSAARLRRYWTRGPGAAKIKWGAPGDFKRCVRQLRKYVGPGAEGLCNVYHRSALGAPPGQGHKDMFDTTSPTYLRAQELMQKAAIQKHAEAHGLELFHGDVKSLEALEMTLEVKGVVRRVRTPAGVARFKQPIGSIIVRDAKLSNLKIKEPKYHGWDLVVGRNGKQYDVGKDEGKWRAYGTDDWDDLAVEADNEEDLYKKLNDLAGSKGKGKAKATGKGKGTSASQSGGKSPKTAPAGSKPTTGGGAPSEKEQLIASLSKKYDITENQASGLAKFADDEYVMEDYAFYRRKGQSHTQALRNALRDSDGKPVPAPKSNTTAAKPGTGKNTLTSLKYEFQLTSNQESKLKTLTPEERDIYADARRNPKGSSNGGHLDGMAVVEYHRRKKNPPRQAQSGGTSTRRANRIERARQEAIEAINAVNRGEQDGLW